LLVRRKAAFRCEAGTRFFVFMAYCILIFMNQEYGEQHTLSLIINTLRATLLKQGFFEHHLYSTQKYKIENTDTFKVKNGLFLRYNPEPDIWQVGEKYDRFFWIGSMFRNEKRLSKFHRNEFTVIDIYFPHGTMKMVVAKFLSLLKALETGLHLQPLSKLPVRYLSHEEFAKQKALLRSSFWMVVTDYPVSESFYDTKGKNRLHTNKFEIFYVHNGVSLEIAACGKLGENINKINYIKGAKKLLNKKVAKKEFIGFGFGLERIAYTYKLFR